jgi:hypothetical protein
MVVNPVRNKWLHEQEFFPDLQLIFELVQHAGAIRGQKA